MRTSFFILAWCLLLSPALAGKKSRATAHVIGTHEAMDRDLESNIMNKKSSLARKGLLRSGREAFAEEPFCVRPFSYPRQN